VRTKWNVTVIKHEYIENVIKTKKGYQKLPLPKVNIVKKKKSVNIENKKIKKGD